MGGNLRLWGAGLGLLALILDGKCALAGAAEGVDICIRTVIPGLFPFLFLSSVLTAALSGSRMPFSRLICRYLGIPQGAEGLLIPGFLGGYPAGAQQIAAAFHTGQLTRSDAEHMLRFCSNAGPAFLFGMVAPCFPDKWMVWALWGIHILSALPGAAGTGRKCGQAVSMPENPASVADLFRRSLSAMAAICGWVVLLRTGLEFLERWVLWALPENAKVAVTGLLELSNGCIGLYRISDPRLRFLLAAPMVSFGGLCVLAQTHSVTRGLSIQPYLRGKCLQALLSLLLAVPVARREFLTGAILGAMMLVIPLMVKKRGSIPAASGV